VQTQLLIAGKLGFGAKPLLQQSESLAEEVARMLVVLMKKLRQ
jgi:hypothetical protein